MYLAWTKKGNLKKRLVSRKCLISIPKAKSPLDFYGIVWRRGYSIFAARDAACSTPIDSCHFRVFLNQRSRLEAICTSGLCQSKVTVAGQGLQVHSGKLRFCCITFLVTKLTMFSKQTVSAEATLSTCSLPAICRLLGKDGLYCPFTIDL